MREKRQTKTNRLRNAVYIGEIAVIIYSVEEEHTRATITNNSKLLPAEYHVTYSKLQKSPTPHLFATQFLSLLTPERGVSQLTMKI